MKFKEILVENGYSQAQLAKELNVSAQLISNWIKRKSQPQLNMVKPIANILNVTADTVIECFVEEEQNAVNKEKHL